MENGYVQKLDKIIQSIGPILKDWQQQQNNYHVSLQNDNLYSKSQSTNKKISKTNKLIVNYKQPLRQTAANSNEVSATSSQQSTSNRNQYNHQPLHRLPNTKSEYTSFRKALPEFIQLRNTILRANLIAQIEEGHQYKSITTNLKLGSEQQEQIGQDVQRKRLQNQNNHNNQIIKNDAAFAIENQNKENSNLNSNLQNNLKVQQSTQIQQQILIKAADKQQILARPKAPPPQQSKELKIAGLELIRPGARFSTGSNTPCGLEFMMLPQVGLGKDKFKQQLNELQLKHSNNINPKSNKISAETNHNGVPNATVKEAGVWQRKCRSKDSMAEYLTQRPLAYREEPLLSTSTFCTYKKSIPVQPPQIITQASSLVSFPQQRRHLLQQPKQQYITQHPSCNRNISCPYFPKVSQELNPLLNSSVSNAEGVKLAPIFEGSKKQQHVNSQRFNKQKCKKELRIFLPSIQNKFKYRHQCEQTRNGKHSKSKSMLDIERKYSLQQNIKEFINNINNQNVDQFINQSAANNNNYQKSIQQINHRFKQRPVENQRQRRQEQNNTTYEFSAVAQKFETQVRPSQKFELKSGHISPLQILGCENDCNEGLAIKHPLCPFEKSELCLKTSETDCDKIQNSTEAIQKSQNACNKNIEQCNITNLLNNLQLYEHSIQSKQSQQNFNQHIHKSGVTQQRLKIKNKFQTEIEEFEHTIQQMNQNWAQNIQNQLALRNKLLIEKQQLNKNFQEQSQNILQNQMNQISTQSTTNLQTQDQNKENIEMIGPNVQESAPNQPDEIEECFLKTQHEFQEPNMMNNHIEPIFDTVPEQNSKFNYFQKSSQDFVGQQNNFTQSIIEPMFNPSFTQYHNFMNPAILPAPMPMHTQRHNPQSLLQLQPSFNSTIENTTTMQQQDMLTLTQQQSCPSTLENNSSLNPNAECFYPKWMTKRDYQAKPIFKVIHNNRKKRDKKGGRRTQRQIQETIVKCYKDMEDQIIQEEFKEKRYGPFVQKELEKNQGGFKEINLPAKRNLSGEKFSLERSNKQKSQQMQSSSLIFNKSRTCIGQDEANVNENSDQMQVDKVTNSNSFQDNIQIKPLDLSEEIKKSERLKSFKQMHSEVINSGTLYCKNLKDIQECLQEKEILDSARRFNPHYIQSELQYAAVPDPLNGHKISKEYRTKMADWMIEVCTSFKCCPRTYFLSVAILDKYLIAQHQHGVILENKDIHAVGVTAMYMGSKYEDVFPLHSRIVSEKIAHNAISPQDIVKKEREFLNLFEFEMDFVTHFDFHQTYCDKIEKQMNHNLKSASASASQQFVAKCQILMQKLADMSLYLTKMAIQCLDFCPYSPSTLVIASLYSATAFLKHSRMFAGEDATRFCTEVRKIIFNILGDELIQHQHFIPKLMNQNPQITETQIQSYQKQYQQDFVEQVAMDLVDFQKLFDEWHCGLNQLKKFHPLPFE